MVVRSVIAAGIQNADMKYETGADLSSLRFPPFGRIQISQENVLGNISIKPPVRNCNGVCRSCGTVFHDALAMATFRDIFIELGSGYVIRFLKVPHIPCETCENDDIPYFVWPQIARRQVVQLMIRLNNGDITAHFRQLFKGLDRHQEVIPKSLLAMIYEINDEVRHPFLPFQPHLAPVIKNIRELEYATAG